jgi:hypothetical protein
MLTFIASLSAFATLLVFAAGAVADESIPAALLLAGVGGASLGILYGILIRLASVTQRHS